MPAALGYNFNVQKQAEAGPPQVEANKGRSIPNDMELKSLSGKAQMVGDALGKQLQARAEDWMQARRYLEEDWIKSIRAYNGMYDYDTLARFTDNESKVFVQLTRMKTDSSYNRACDLLFGAEDHWDLKPSPVPEVDPERKAELKQMIMDMQLKQQAQQYIQNNGVVDPAQFAEPTDDELNKTDQLVSKKAAKKMRMKIADQIEQGWYELKCRKALFEMCVIGTGVMKGPMVSVETKGKWKRYGGEWKLNEDEEILPRFSAPSIIDTFSDPYVSQSSDGLGTFERHVMRKDQLVKLASQPHFDEVAIEELLKNYEGGNHWESYMDIEIRWVSGQGISGEPEKRFDVWEYWGWIDGRDLMAAGMTNDKIEAHKSYYCNVWHSGGITIRATVSPNKPARHMYKLIPYKEVIGSQYGVGVPYLMKDSQETVNSAARELINNAALSSGPQVEVFIDMIDLDAGEDPRELVPWRVWPRIGGDMAHPAVRFTDIPNTTESMAKIIQIWRAFADEETNIPAYTHGSTQLTGAAGKTASGMSMMMGAASMDIKGVVKNWDNYFVKPFIEEMYHFNMYWSDEEDIKGDMEPEATGSTTLMAKEIKSQRVVAFLTLTNNPIDMQIMGMERRARLLREAAASIDIDPDDAAPNPDDTPLDAMGQGQPGMGMGVPGQPQPGMNAPGMEQGIPGTMAPQQPGAKPPTGGAPDMTPGGPGMNQVQPGVAPQGANPGGIM